MPVADTLLPGPALGVNRRTVSARLAAIEDRLERSLEPIRAELDLALRLGALESHSPELAEPERTS